MRKNSKYFRLHVIVMTILMSTPLLIGSCNDDNIPNENNDENSVRIYEELKTQALIASLCKTDTLEDGTITYSSQLGKQLYSITPTVYYIGIDSLVEAENTYFSIISVLQDSTYSIRDYDIQQGDCHLSFVVENKPDEIARIDIDCPTLKNYLTSIVFIPLELWPENGMGTPFNYLSLWKNDEGHYYLCVKESKGGDGIMITFDGGYGIDSFTKYVHWQKKFDLWSNTATKQAFESFCYILQNIENTKSKEMLAKLNAQKDRNGNGDRLLEIFNTVIKYRENHKTTGIHSTILYNFLLALKTPELATFDRDYQYDHGLWCAHYCYYVYLHRTSIRMNGSYLHRCSYYEHKERPEQKLPSHSFTFSPSYKKDGWHCVYAGG